MHTRPALTLAPLPHFDGLPIFEAVEYDDSNVADLLAAMDHDSDEVTQIAVLVPIVRPAMEYSTF